MKRKYVLTSGIYLLAVLALGIGFAWARLDTQGFLARMIVLQGGLYSDDVQAAANPLLFAVPLLYVVITSFFVVRMRELATLSAEKS